MQTCQQELVEAKHENQLLKTALTITEDKLYVEYSNQCDELRFPNDPEGYKAILDFACDFIGSGIRSISKQAPTYDTVYDMHKLTSFEFGPWLQTFCNSSFSFLSSTTATVLNATASALDYHNDATGLFYFLDKLLSISGSKFERHSEPFLISQIFSCLLECFNPLFVNPFALKTQLITKDHTVSPFMTNVVGGILPGGVSNSYLSARKAKVARSMGSLRSLPFNFNCNFKFVIDNAADAYFKFTSESRTFNLQNSIWTNAAVIACYDDDDSNNNSNTESNEEDNNMDIGDDSDVSELLFARQMKFSPELWPAISGCSPQYLNFGYPGFPHLSPFRNHIQALDSHAKHVLSEYFSELRDKIIETVTCALRDQQERQLNSSSNNNALETTFFF